MNRHVPSLVPDFGKDVAQPDDDQAEGDPDCWASLRSIRRDECRNVDERMVGVDELTIAMLVGDEVDQRTIARNVSIRLLLARKAKKFMATKALKRRSVNFISNL